MRNEFFPVKKITMGAAIAFIMILPLSLMPLPATNAADHRDAPITGFDPGEDIGDVYFFLDPNDNSRVILAFDTHGFIVPAENANLGFFDSEVRHRFQIENTGDAAGDLFLDVTFSKQVSRTTPQTATLALSGREIFTAPTTISSSTADLPPSPVVTTDPATGISFFAGLVDDPFFFDHPGRAPLSDVAACGYSRPLHFQSGSRQLCRL